MGWLQNIAGEMPLKGQVVVTRVGGGSTTYVNVDTAEVACSGLKGKLQYFRGAFFETGAAPKKAPASAVPLVPVMASSKKKREE